MNNDLLYLVLQRQLLFIDLVDTRRIVDDHFGTWWEWKLIYSAINPPLPIIQFSFWYAPRYQQGYCDESALVPL